MGNIPLLGRKSTFCPTNPALEVMNEKFISKKKHLPGVGAYSYLQGWLLA